jgi:membrane protein YqaA with SNARE-associated domain
LLPWQHTLRQAPSTFTVDKAARIEYAHESMELLQNLADSPSLAALFFLSFLASTLLPIGSEWLLVLMIVQGFSRDQLVLTASLGNFLGACTTYLIGIHGSDFIIRKVLRVDAKNLSRAGRFYEKYGVWSLFFSWLPVVGDPLCLLAGIFRVRFDRFSLLVFGGKFLRYAALAALVAKGSGA